MFSAMTFLKSKLRNKLHKNVDTCLRLYVTKYEVDNFPYERALALWRSERERKGENNITNISNELDVKNEDQSQNEDQGQNVTWKLNFT